MKFVYEQKRVITSAIYSRDKVESLAHHTLEQEFGQNILNDIEYLIRQTITATNKDTEEKIYSISIAYKYLVTEVNSASSTIVVDIIDDSFKRFYDDHQEFLGDHFLAAYQVTLEPDYDLFIKEFNKYVSSLNN